MLVNTFSASRGGIGERNENKLYSVLKRCPWFFVGRRHLASDLIKSPTKIDIIL